MGVARAACTWRLWSADSARSVRLLATRMSAARVTSRNGEADALGNSDARKVVSVGPQITCWRPVWLPGNGSHRD
jgi:hypothetical protein